MLQEVDWARKVAVGCSAGGHKSNRKNERVRTKCPPSPAHSFIAQLRPTPCRCTKERERKRERREREGRGLSPVHTQHEEGRREREGSGERTSDFRRRSDRRPCFSSHYVRETALRPGQGVGNEKGRERYRERRKRQREREEERREKREAERVWEGAPRAAVGC